MRGELGDACAPYVQAYKPDRVGNILYWLMSLYCMRSWGWVATVLGAVALQRVWLGTQHPHHAIYKKEKSLRGLLDFQSHIHAPRLTHYTTQVSYRPQLKEYGQHTTTRPQPPCFGALTNSTKARQQKPPGSASHIHAPHTTLQPQSWSKRRRPIRQTTPRRPYLCCPCP